MSENQIRTMNFPFPYDNPNVNWISSENRWKVEPVGLGLSAIHFKSKDDAWLAINAIRHAYRRGKDDMAAEIRHLLNVPERQDDY